MTLRTCRTCGDTLTYIGCGRPPVMCRPCRTAEIAEKQRAYYEANKPNIPAEIITLLSDGAKTEVEMTKAIGAPSSHIALAIDTLYSDGRLIFGNDGRYELVAA